MFLKKPKILGLVFCKPRPRCASDDWKHQKRKCLVMIVNPDSVGSSPEVWSFGTAIRVLCKRIERKNLGCLIPLGPVGLSVRGPDSEPATDMDRTEIQTGTVPDLVGCGLVGN